MAWNGPPVGDKPSQTLRWGETDYWLVPMDEGSAMPRTRAQRSELQRFDSRELAKVDEFVYDNLPRSKQRIRLLQLRSGTTDGREIFCELVEADYDNSFHIPTKVDANEKLEEEKRRKEEEKMTEEEKKRRKEEEQKQKRIEVETARAELKKRKEQRDKMSKAEKDEEDKKEEEENERRLRGELERVIEKEIQYEALSWYWGVEEPVYAVTIQYQGKAYKKKVRRELALALKYLRLPNETRTLWIDAICINQDNHDERNHQVQMMSRIYTRAKEVCIWLGEDSDESKTAIDFIHNEITELKNIDKICSDKKYTHKWQALLMLMQRPWFSRRWVVQEIALASRAKLYCGPNSIS